MPKIFNRRSVLAGAAALGAGSYAMLAGQGGQVPARALAQEGEAAMESDLLTAPMSIGDADAPVTIIEYASLTCPHCARFHGIVYPQIKENYVETGQVRFEMREVYFDRPGLWGAMLARCDGGSRYFGILDLLYARQADWSRADTAQEVVAQLGRIGAQAGLNQEQIQACLSDAALAEALVAQYQTHMEEHQISGTPSFVVNGTMHSNMSYEDFAAVIEDEL